MFSHPLHLARLLLTSVDNLSLTRYKMRWQQDKLKETTNLTHKNPFHLASSPEYEEKLREKLFLTPMYMHILKLCTEQQYNAE